MATRPSRRDAMNAMSSRDARASGDLHPPVRLQATTPATAMLSLQRRAGNRAVIALLRSAYGQAPAGNTAGRRMLQRAPSGKGGIETTEVCRRSRAC